MSKKFNFLLEKIGARFESTLAKDQVDWSLPGEETEQVDRVILMTLDTLRADHLHCYGYPRPVTPFLDEISANGFQFNQASTSISTTVPAHASIFTSLYPVQHNVLKNGHRMNDGFMTIAGQLAKQGFSTAAFVSTNRHFVAGNIVGGFDHVDEPSDSHYIYRRAKHTINAAMEWVSQRKPDEKFFIWIHLFDPHEPYKTPLSKCDVLQKESLQDHQQQKEYFLEHQKVNADFFDRGEEEMMEILDAYDAEISYMDSHIRRFYKFVQQQPAMNEKMAWILTGDHGEGLGNHYWMGHGKNLYEEQTHIPLLFHFPSRSTRGIKIDQFVEHVDIFPTIMDLTNASIEEQSQPIQGDSLVPLLQEKQLDFNKEYAFITRRHFDPKNRPEKVDAFRDNFEDGEKFALRNEVYKYILKTVGEDEFYDLSQDPYEVNNLIGTGLEDESRFRSALTDKINQFKQNVDTAPQSVDNETIERLKDLGYFQ